MTLKEPRHPLGTWGTTLELEVRRRIQVSIAAYAYEIASDPIMSDSMFDWHATRIRKHVGTCHPLLDEFFVVHFSPMTGMWIHQHPQLDRVARAYDRHGEDMRTYFALPGVQPDARKALHQREK